MTETLKAARQRLRESRFDNEAEVVHRLLAAEPLSTEGRSRSVTRAMTWVERLRSEVAPTLMESFLAEYGLSTEEGVALMCLAEAYLRVPDPETLDALIRDKIGSGQWSTHLRSSRSSLVNASSWALMLTGRIVSDGDSADDLVTETVRRLVQRVGEPVVRTAVAQAMKVLGRQFVRGRDIDEAIDHGAGMVAQGYTYSYDMLGEAAKTEADARRYFMAYSGAIQAIARHANSELVHANPGISVKLSALHPRFETTQRARVMRELLPRLAALAELARNANVGLTVDAEEVDRLDLSLALAEALLGNVDLAGWEGFGIVVQAYSKQALPLLEWINALADRHGSRIAVRLVKGAYWDSEIKLAQQLGVENYPVFTRKAATDLSYLACARFLLDRVDNLYPQFATHNAHTVAAVLELAGDRDDFEFQRLHGMGEALYEMVRIESGRRCRIYAPVGVHRDLLAYLVRRLLENGANSSFVHQLLNEEVPPTALVADPVATMVAADPIGHPRIPLPPDLYAPERRNARGWDINDPLDTEALDKALTGFSEQQWHASPTLARGDGTVRKVVNPARSEDRVGSVVDATPKQATEALTTAVAAFPEWRDRPTSERAALLERVADQYEAHAVELVALAIREAGKTRLDGLLEVREAVDFCRYYAARARAGQVGERRGLGPFVCISPWNFPLAIFTGQVVAALVAGNSVVAKPAEQTPLMAARAVALMHEAGIPSGVLTLMPGPGATIGATLVADSRVGGVCFTGSIETAILIDRAMAATGNPRAPLIAETGGLNAMLVDSTALPEHAVSDIVASAFQSAGQRCSALRVLCLQREVADTVLEMLEGALTELEVGDPWQEATDVGPVIDVDARTTIEAHCHAFTRRDRLLFSHPFDCEGTTGHYVAPTVLRIDSLTELEREVFGPVLHVLTFEAEKLDAVVDAINASDYGLTLGVHSRVGDRVDRVCARARVGNIYVNRNQIGAVVGVQPFGGEGLSGTGPKAGGPHYLDRFTAASNRLPLFSGEIASAESRAVSAIDWQQFIATVRPVRQGWEQDDGRLATLARASALLAEELGTLAASHLDAVGTVLQKNGQLSGPTGESNTLSWHGRGPVLCLGGGPHSTTALLLQALSALAMGNPVALAAGVDDVLAARLVMALDQAGVPAGLAGVVMVSDDDLATLPGLRVVALEGDDGRLDTVRRALAARDGVRVPLVALAEGVDRFATERVISVDTTASGGNTALLTLDPYP